MTPEERAQMVRSLRMEMKQRVDMTARPGPRGSYGPEARRVQAQIMARHPLDPTEDLQADKLTRMGTDHYDAYWGVRNQRYDRNGRPRRRRNARAVRSTLSFGAKR